MSRQGLIDYGNEKDGLVLIKQRGDISAFQKVSE